MKTIQQSTAINAIRNYVYFTYNFPQPDEFIRNCWAGDKVMADHLLEKLRSYDYDINKFFVNLSSGHQEEFAAWIYEHYHDAPKGTDEKRTIIEMWHQFKANHPDHIILFRCGDFYKAIGEDARVCVKALGVTLLNRNDDNLLHPQVECAFPYHALDTYLPLLIRKEYRVCICDGDLNG